MSVAELLADLCARDVKLSRCSGQIVLDAPKGTLALLDIDEIRVHKPKLLRMLASRRVSECTSAIAADLARGKPSIGFPRFFPAAVEVEARHGYCGSCGERTRGGTCADCTKAYEHLAIRPVVLVSEELEWRIGIPLDESAQRWIDTDEDPFSCDEE